MSLKIVSKLLLNEDINIELLFKIYYLISMVLGSLWQLNKIKFISI
jgi:hypothetical protein